MYGDQKVTIREARQSSYCIFNATLSGFSVVCKVEDQKVAKANQEGEETTKRKPNLITEGQIRATL